MSKKCNRFDDQRAMVGLICTARELVEIVEGIKSTRWSNGEMRLKDTPEWCHFYVAMCKVNRRLVESKS